MFLKTMHLSPTTVIVVTKVNLIDGLDTDKIETVTTHNKNNHGDIVMSINLWYVFIQNKKIQLP